MTRDREPPDLSDLVLGEADPRHEREALEADPQLRDRVAELRGVAARLGDLPAEAWHAGPQAEASRPARGWLRGRRLALAGAVAAVLFVSGLAAGLALEGGSTEPGEQRAGAVRLEPPTGAAGATGVAARLNGGRLELSAAGLEPSGSEEFYELWLLGSRGRLVSLGSFRVPGSGRVRVAVPLPADPGQYRFIDVSREPADGDPSHSRDSVLRGPAA